jgi:ketosteroid isomerase-like protein
VLLASLTVAAAAAGCGADTEGGDDAQAVRDVVTRFGDASRARDYQTICDRLLADALIQKVEAIGLPCETALQKGLADVRDPRLQVRDVAVSGGRALVSVHSTAAGQPPSDDAIQLVREDGAWRIASLASPEGGTSTRTPPATTTRTTTTTTG